MISTPIISGTLAETGESVDILIENNIITKITPKSETVETSNLLIFPGLIDCHVHFREPGYEDKATMQTESEAARAGGVTTVCEMPNTNPPTTSVDAFRDKTDCAKGAGIDIRFFFGMTKVEHIQELLRLWEDEELRARCSGVKVFFDHSTGNQGAEKEAIEAAFEVCAKLGITLVGHCEDPQINKDAASAVTNTDVAAHSQMRPPESEAKAVELAISLAKKYGTHFHVAHLSTRQGIDLVRQAKADGLPVTCEVSPHHLFLSTDDYEALGTLGKMNPPLRAKEHQKALWEGIAGGTVDCVATDHAPHLLEEKQTDNPLDAPSGVPGVETMVPLLLTKLDPSTIMKVCFTNPNKIFNLGKKGIKEGASADLTLINPKEEWTIKGSELHSKCGWTPFEGRKVQGKIVRTIMGS